MVIYSYFGRIAKSLRKSEGKDVGCTNSKKWNYQVFPTHAKQYWNILHKLEKCIKPVHINLMIHPILVQMNGVHISKKLATKDTSDDKYLNGKLKQLEESRYQTDMTDLDAASTIREIKDEIKSRGLVNRESYLVMISSYMACSI